VNEASVMIAIARDLLDQAAHKLSAVDPTNATSVLPAGRRPPAGARGVPAGAPARGRPDPAG